MTTAWLLLIALGLAPVIEQSPQRASRQTLAKRRAALEPVVLITTLPAADIKSLPSGKVIEHNSDVARSEAVTIVVSMPTCQRDAKGLCNASADIVVAKPDGTSHSTMKIELPGGRGTVTLPLVPGDLTGVYKVVATVRDRTARRFGKAERSFGVK